MKSRLKNLSKAVAILLGDPPVGEKAGFEEIRASADRALVYVETLDYKAKLLAIARIAQVLKHLAAPVRRKASTKNPKP